MKYEILNESGLIINTIVADQQFVDLHYPGKHRLLSDENDLIELAIIIRTKRDRLLQESDWIVIKSYELNQNIPGIWEIYRQALRDIPQQPGFPANVNFPNKPE